MPNPSDPTLHTTPQTLTDQDSEGPAYVKPALKPLGEWHLVVRSSGDSEAADDGFFDIGF